MSVLDFVRADLREFAGYRSARSDKLEGAVWLNANESAWSNLADPQATLRRYPDPQPQRLREVLSQLYGCRAEQLLAGRGSDEGIDLLLRATCRPGQDAVVITTPTFGMYAVCARLHGTRVVDVPLLDREEGLECDFEAVAAAAEQAEAKLVFLCSPGNPGGNALPLHAVADLARRLGDRALVVVDEAYAEFVAPAETPDAASAVSLMSELANLVVLRTLSKAHALAAARIGSVIADADLIEVLRRCQAPYPLPQPCVELALAALSSEAQARTRERVARCQRERARMLPALARMRGVNRVYPSQANFLLVRFADAQLAFERLLDAGVVVRDVRAMPGLQDALRITLGTSEQNDRVLAVLEANAPQEAAA